METWQEIVLAVFASVMASSGLWAFLQALIQRKGASNQMLLGLGHDRIIWLCTRYIDRGWISNEEYEDLMRYLYEPYRKMGGNGTAQRMINEVQKLPIHQVSHVTKKKETENVTLLALIKKWIKMEVERHE